MSISSGSGANNKTMIDEKEIRSEIDKYTEELYTIAEAYDKFQDFFNETANIVSGIRKQAFEYARKQIRHVEGIDPNKVQLENVKMPFNPEHFDSDIIRSIYRFAGYTMIKRSANEFKAGIGDLDNYIDDASAFLKNSFGWFLTSAQKKERAVYAMERIDELYNTGFQNKVDKFIKDYESLDLKEAENEFRAHTQSFVNLLNQITKMGFYVDDDPEKPDFKEFQQYRNGYDKTVYVLKTISNDSQRIKDEIHLKASKMAEKEALKVLDDVSVDEINKDKKGIRVSALKNAGIETIADVIRKSEYSIASIYGISEMNAHIVKTAAQDFFNKTKNSMKLRINTDEKTEDSAVLLNSLYKYMKRKELYDSADQLFERYGKTLSKILDNTSEKDDDLHWLYADIERKRFLADTYQLFKDLVRYRYVDKVIALNKERSPVGHEVLSDAEIWDFFEKNSAACISQMEELLPDYFGNSDTFYGLPEELAEKIQEECIFPDGLLVTLRRYQEWGVKYILHQKKVLLGDEMGLGKTIQAIAAMVSLRNVGEDHFLVICPASVLINWCREIEKHSKLKAFKMHGSGRKQSFDRWMKEGGVGVTTYETINAFEMPSDYRYSMLVVDEAHYVKNTKALRTSNVIKAGQHTDRILYMTGTPLENKVEEMIELISQLQPQIAKEVSSYTYMATSEIFRQKIAPVYYRRKREDVLTELPELIEAEEWCSLEDEEKRIYEDAILGKHRDEARKVSWNVDDLSLSCKAQRLKEIVEQVKEDGRKLIVFSFYLDTIRKLYEYFHEICLFPITGGVNVNKRQTIIDEFEKAAPGTMLIAQITAGGTGLNIQAASVVVIAEPQYKPSIENQAISRAYRMGQTRNVLVYRLLCENTIDERMIERLKEKQREFDAFADKSVAAQANLELDDNTISNIIEEEIERIEKERGINHESEDDLREERISPNRRNLSPVPVTGRIKVVSQPYGGYLKAKDMTVNELNDGRILNREENKSPGTIGIVVDYMTRFMLTKNVREAFSISISGASLKDGIKQSEGEEIKCCEHLLNGIKGLDDASIINACFLSEYDIWRRDPLSALMITDDVSVEPNKDTITNIRTMVERSLAFVDKYGPIVKYGFTFEPNGYSEVVTSGDGDFLTKDTLWDFKVSKNEPTKDNTLQLLMYYIMGKHSGNHIFDGIRKIGIYNPRLNKVYLYEMDKYPEKLYREIEEDIICYK